MFFNSIVSPLHKKWQALIINLIIYKYLVGMTKKQL